MASMNSAEQGCGMSGCFMTTAGAPMSSRGVGQNFGVLYG
jgi:hypothetical protein